MQLRLLAVGTKPPQWVKQGFDEYHKRLQHSVKLQLIEIPAFKRGKNTYPEQARLHEAQLIEKYIHPQDTNIALVIKGQSWSTEQLAQKWQQWQQQGQTINLIIGGPDGLADSILSRSCQYWSLSKLTFPHALVRIILIEQIYRAHSLLNDHPYHR